MPTKLNWRRSSRAAAQHSRQPNSYRTRKQSENNQINIIGTLIKLLLQRLGIRIFFFKQVAQSTHICVEGFLWPRLFINSPLEWRVRNTSMARINIVNRKSDRYIWLVGSSVLFFIGFYVPIRDTSLSPSIFLNLDLYFWLSLDHRCSRAQSLYDWRVVWCRVVSYCVMLCCLMSSRLVSCCIVLCHIGAELLSRSLFLILICISGWDRGMG